jgi:hypothetical protein
VVQPLSTRPNYPAFGFGTSGRVSTTKLFFTKEIAAANNMGMVRPSHHPPRHTHTPPRMHRVHTHRAPYRHPKAVHRRAGDSQELVR